MKHAIFNHFLNHTGTYVPRTYSLNFAELGWEQNQLSHLDLPFSQSEVYAVIKATPKDKAPDSDGFIGSFFSICWEIIKDDLLNAIL
jgi:hypothetical protein